MHLITNYSWFDKKLLQPKLDVIRKGYFQCSPSHICPPCLQFLQLWILHLEPYRFLFCFIFDLPRKHGVFSSLVYSWKISFKKTLQQLSSFEILTNENKLLFNYLGVGFVSLPWKICKPSAFNHHKKFTSPLETKKIFAVFELSWNDSQILWICHICMPQHNSETSPKVCLREI